VTPALQPRPSPALITGHPPGPLIWGHYEAERVGKAFPLLKCLRTHYGRNCEPFPDPKCTRLQDCAYTVATLSGGDTRGLPQRNGATSPASTRSGAWTQTPISDWLASAPIVAVCFTKRPLSQMITGPTLVNTTRCC